MRIRTAVKGVIFSSIFLLIVSCFTIPSLKAEIFNKAYAISNDGKVIHYYNSDVNADTIGNNNFNFGPDRKAQADIAVANGWAQSVQQWTATNTGEGDFFRSIEADPALCAAVGLHMDESLILPEVILRDEQDVLIGQRADKAHLHFLSDREYWNRAIRLIKEYLCRADISIEPLKGRYTSQMYMRFNGLEGNKPSVIVRDTQNSGGHVVVFDLGKPGRVKFRLECGYQPVDVPYWNPPSPTPTPTPRPTPTPKPTPTPSPTPTGSPTPTPTPTPTPAPTPTPTPTPSPSPTPTLAPKPTDGGPQGQTDDDEEGVDDFGGGPNHDNDETPSEEPQSPDTYVPPDPPQPETEETGSDQHEPTQDNPSKPVSEPDGSSGTDSGSYTVDHDNGTTEEHTTTNPDTGQPVSQEYEVVAGDGGNHGDLNEIQEQHHIHDTIEPAVQGDGVNQGDLSPDDVE